MPRSLLHYKISWKSMVMEHDYYLLVLDNSSFATEVNSIQELSDILVAHKANLVNQRGGSTDELDIVSGEDQFVLDCVGPGNGHSWKHLDHSDTFLSQEVTDLNLCSILHNVDVDGEMGVY